MCLVIIAKSKKDNNKKRFTKSFFLITYYFLESFFSNFVLLYNRFDFFIGGFMKKSLIFASVMAILLAGCSSNSHDKDYHHEHDGFHEHSNGVYKEHEHHEMMEKEKAEKEMMKAEEEMVMVTSQAEKEMKEAEDMKMKEEAVMKEAMAEKMDNHIHLVVEEGDTLSELIVDNVGNHGGHSLEDLINKVAEKNNIDNPDLIFPGQTIDLSM